MKKAPNPRGIPLSSLNSAQAYIALHVAISVAARIPINNYDIERLHWITVPDRNFHFSSETGHGFYLQRHGQKMHISLTSHNSATNIYRMRSVFDAYTGRPRFTAPSMKQLLLFDAGTVNKQDVHLPSKITQKKIEIHDYGQFKLF